MSEEIKDLRIDNPELYILRNNKEDGFNYQSRRHPEWTENYTLYRDKIIINRLEQRQTVNIPLMKTVLRSLLKDVDDMPELYFENTLNNKEAEIFINECWGKTLEDNQSSVQDIVDKRQVFHFGRSFDRWQIKDGKIVWTVEDPNDILVSRYMITTDLNSTRYLIHNHIFTPLSEIENNDQYDKAAIERLKLFYATEQGLFKVANNAQMLTEKNQKMADMGVSDIDNPILGETYVEQSIHFVFKDNEKGPDGQLLPPQYFMYIEIDNEEIVFKKPFEEVVGATEDHWFRTHLTYHTWADDVDHQDFWTDGIADIVRTPNKILNAWFSQITENRTLRNYNMYFYDSSAEGFNPGSFDPIPFGFYPVPGKPTDVMTRFDIPALTDSLNEMNFLIDMVKNATGASSAQQGATEERQITLGEIQLSLGEAKERIKGMAKFYLPVWKQRGMTFIKLLEAGKDKLDAVKIYKKGKNTSDIYQREIGPKDWKAEDGYLIKVWSQEDKATDDANNLQKQAAVKQTMPDNPKVDEIYKRKLLSFADYTPEEINQILEIEKKKFEDQQMIMNQQKEMQMNGQVDTNGQPIQGGPQPQALPEGPIDATSLMPQPGSQLPQPDLSELKTGPEAAQAVPEAKAPVKKEVKKSKKKSKSKSKSKKKEILNKLKSLKSKIKK